jgi:hypothetical protein
VLGLGFLLRSGSRILRDCIAKKPDVVGLFVPSVTGLGDSFSPPLFVVRLQVVRDGNHVQMPAALHRRIIAKRAAAIGIAAIFLDISTWVIPRRPRLLLV